MAHSSSATEISCMPRQAEKRVVLFDVQAICLRHWDDAEARRFADGAKMLAR